MDQVTTVREGQRVWPYCSDCGCRLKLRVWRKLVYASHFDGPYEWWSSLKGVRDARGCHCPIYQNEILRDEESIIYTEDVYKGALS